MLKRLLPALGLLLATTLPACVHAAPQPDWLKQAREMHLADDPYWHLLLRYQRGDAPSGYISRVKNQHRFFLSENGETSPAGELEADLSIWLAESHTPANKSVSCTFPARIAWLRERLGITEADHAPASCPELEDWLKAINPAQATLIFASDYLNNPSSMFGHTLLRIDTPEQTEETRLLAYAINYAAQTKESNGLLFAINGLTGGYPGAFSVMPYYDKVKEYNDFENRDLWEYQLTLTPVEIRRSLLNLWELKGISFPYFFFSDNCSFELLSLFEVARPGVELQKQFPVYAIPTDTVRAVLAQQGFLKAVVYRPASATRLEVEVRRNSSAVNDAAKVLTAKPDATPALPPVQQAQAYETAYDDLYYRFLGHAATPEAPQRLRALLVARSQVDAPDQRVTPPQPAVNPAEGHATRRLSVDAGVDGDEGYMGLDIRPAYHDLLDAPGGYRPGARIDFLDTGLAYEPDNHRVFLDHFTLIAIDSLAERDAFLKPISWGLAGGQRRDALDSDGRFSTTGRRSVGYFEGGAGISASPAGSTLCYGQLWGDVEASTALQEGWRTGLGPRLGCIGHAGDWGQWQLELKSLYRNAPSAWDSKASLGLQYNLGRNNALRLSGTVETQDDQTRSGGELAWLHYF